MFLTNGSNGAPVFMLQYLLDRLGYKVPQNGFFDADTEAAVKDFQQKSGITADGVFGPQTWDKTRVALDALTPKPLAVIPARVEGYAYHFDLDVVVDGQTHTLKVVKNMVFDTGDFELLFTPATAKMLGLVQTGTLGVEGVGGGEQAELSKVAIVLGGVTYENVNCIVADAPSDLFGERFLVNRGMAACENPVKETITLWAGVEVE